MSQCGSCNLQMLREVPDQWEIEVGVSLRATSPLGSIGLWAHHSWAASWTGLLSVCLKWYVGRSNQIVMLNWLRLNLVWTVIRAQDKAGGSKWLPGKSLKLSGSNAAKFREDLSMNTEDISCLHWNSVGKNTMFLLNNGAIESFI